MEKEISLAKLAEKGLAPSPPALLALLPSLVFFLDAEVPIMLGAMTA
jgi:hypothetical protein